MYSDVIPKSFSKSSREENAGSGLNPPWAGLPLSFRYTQRGPKRGPLEPRGLRVTDDVVYYNKNIRGDRNGGSKRGLPLPFWSLTSLESRSVELPSYTFLGDGVRTLASGVLIV